jgi:hypothetical protein
LLPLAFVALLASWRHHHNPLPLMLQGAAIVVGYLHVFGGTPEWTMYGTAVISLLAAFYDWRANRRYFDRLARRPAAIVVEAPAAR